MEWDGDGTDPRELRLIEGKKCGEDTRFEPISLEELRESCRERPEDILLPFIREGDATLIYSPSGVGKSFYALGIAVAIASGSEFLGYTAPKARKVLYLDGEMSKWQLKSRVDASITPKNNKLAYQNLSLANRELSDYLFPDIGSKDGWKWAYREVIRSGVEVVVFDNFSTLALGVEDENNAGSFNNTLELILRLKKQGVLPILLHHSNKTGNSYRGTTKIEAIFSNIISLEKTNAIDLSLGAGFKVKFTKNRNEYAEETETRTVQLVRGDGWKVLETDEDRDDRVLVELKKMTHKKQAEIAAALGVNQSTIARAKKRLIATGKIKKGQWTRYLTAANDELGMKDEIEMDDDDDDEVINF
ncbi:MAG TPA: AAA family ATPase [Phycisphaerales bacterium]|nr:AAA family ATPase [Phycisphaerales bacterium]